MDQLKEEYDNLLSYRKGKVPPRGGIKGTCDTFCPYFEMVERRLRNDVSFFEKHFMIKKYVRSAAGRTKSLEEDVRPINVLCDCFNYLLKILEEYCNMNREKLKLLIAQDNISKEQQKSMPKWVVDRPSLLELYKFIEDRTRAIRLDITIQELSCTKTTKLLQQICNFHIIFNFLLYDTERFEEHLNVDQIRRILITLSECYKSQKGILMTLDQQKYTAFNIFLKISGDQLDHGEGFFSNSEKYINCDIFCQYDVINEATKLLLEMQRGNISYFFKFMRKSDFLTRCLLTTQLKYVRKAAMDMFKIGFYEKIDCGLLMSWLQITDRAYFEREGVVIEENKLCFRERPFVPREVHAKLLPSFNFKLPDNLKMAVRCDAREFFLQKMIFEEYIREVLKRFISKKNIKCVEDYRTPKKMTINYDQIVIHIYQEYAHKLALKMMLRSIFLEKTDLLQLWLKKAKKRKNKRKLLLVVLEKTVSAAMFRQKIKNSPLKPSFTDYRPDISVNEILLYKMTLFVVAKKHHQHIKSHYYMANKMVIVPSTPVMNLEEAVENANYIVKRRLKDLINGSKKEKALSMMCELVWNKRNPDLKKAMIEFEKNNTLSDIHVYLEEEEESRIKNL